MSFASVRGHERVKGLLARMLAAGRLPSALLFAGPDGVGKRTLALALARALLCERPADGPCDACGSCRRLLRATEQLPDLRERAAAGGEDDGFNLYLHPNVILVEPSPPHRQAKEAVEKGRRMGRERLKIEQIRALSHEVHGRPFETGARTIVVDDAQEMEEGAANAFLKTLEEPPPATHFVLVSASPEGLRGTIRSRCQMIRFGPLPSQVVEEELQKRGEIPPEQARLLARLSGGSLGAALALADESQRAVRTDLLGLLEGRPALEAMDLAERLAELDAADLELALNFLRSLLRDVAALRAGATADALVNLDLADRLGAVARGPLGERALALAEAARSAQFALRGNARPLLVMDRIVDDLAFR